MHVPITWYDGGSMQSKLEIIDNAIRSVPHDARVVLVGESAGGSLALNTAARNARVARVITLCGVARPDTPISAYLRRKAPALHEAVQVLPVSFKTEVVSVRAAIDGVVGKKYSSTNGATVCVVWSVGHLTTIALCLTILSFYMAKLAKKEA